MNETLVWLFEWHAGQGNITTQALLSLLPFLQTSVQFWRWRGEKYSWQMMTLISDHISVFNILSQAPTDHAVEASFSLSGWWREV